MKALFQNDKHTVKAVKAERITNGSISVHMHCCDNPSTEWRHTLYPTPGMTTDQIDQKLAEVAQQVADLHESMDIAHNYILGFVEERPADQPTMELK